VEIQLTQGKVAIVDDSDFDSIEDLRKRWWGYRKFGSRGYAWRYIGPRGRGNGRKRLLMQDLILVAPAGLEIDHINGDGLDNRRENLRAVTHEDVLESRKAFGKVASKPPAGAFGRRVIQVKTEEAQHRWIFASARAAALSKGGFVREIIRRAMEDAGVDTSDTALEEFEACHLTGYVSREARSSLLSLLGRNQMAYSEWLELAIARELEG